MILYETDKLYIENEFETAWLKDKLTGQVLLEDHFYGDPSCGLISETHHWAIIGGDHLTLWTPEKWLRIEVSNLKWIHALRAENPETVEILTDPWGEQPAIWEMNMQTFEPHKVKDFEDYTGKPYTGRVVW